MTVVSVLPRESGPDGSDGQGIGSGFVLDTVRRTLAALRRDGRVEYAYLGLATAGIHRSSRAASLFP